MMETSRGLKAPEISNIGRLDRLVTAATNFTIKVWEVQAVDLEIKISLLSRVI